MVVPRNGDLLLFAYKNANNTVQNNWPAKYLADENGSPCSGIGRSGLLAPL
jgi:hypothetical protein